MHVFFLNLGAGFDKSSNGKAGPVSFYNSPDRLRLDLQSVLMLFFVVQRVFLYKKT